MLGIIFGLIASIGQGVGYVYIKKSYKELSPSIAFLFNAMFAILLWVPFALISGVDFSNIGQVFIIAFISAILAEAYVMYVFSKGELSLTSTIFSTYPIFTVIISVLFLDESATGLVWLAIGIVIFGVLITSLPNKINKNDLDKRAYLLWPLSAAILVGISDSISKDIVDQTNAATFLFALAFAEIIIALIFLRIEKVSLKQFKEVRSNFDKYKNAVIGSFAISSTLIAFWLAFEHTLASIASPLTATYAVALLIFAHYILEDELSRKDKIGIFITISGTILLSYLLA